MKKAILVTATFTTRVVLEVGDEPTPRIDKNALIEAVAPKFEQKLFHELNENITEVVEDTECPYEEGEDD